MSLEEASKAAVQQLGAPRDDYPASLKYVQVPSGALAYCHVFQLRDDKASKWYQVAVDVTQGQIVSVVNFYKRASYKAIKLPNSTPFDGFEMVVDPEDLKASPYGWNKDDKKAYTNTVGNNIDVSDVYHVNGQVSIPGVPPFRPESTGSLVFDSNWKSSEQPSSDSNKRASAIHLFYRTKFYFI